MVVILSVDKHKEIVQGLDCQYCIVVSFINVAISFRLEQAVRGAINIRPRDLYPLPALERNRTCKLCCAF